MGGGLPDLKLFALLLVAVLASDRIGRAASRFRLPLITGFLLAGVLTGPYVLSILSADQVIRLRFVDEIALAFIAFAAGAELQYRELRHQLKRIWWITLGVVTASYLLVVPIFVFLGDVAPFLSELGTQSRLAVGLIAGAVLVSRSPSSLMALIAELRARGPFTRMLIGITVALDVVVIVLFAISSSVADVLLRDSDFELGFIFIVVGELLIAGLVGCAVAAIVHAVLRFGRHPTVQSLLLLTTGFGVYWMSHWVRDASHTRGPFEVFLEPLLICMVGGFLVGNFSAYRSDFQRVLKLAGAPVFLAFFTLAGASLDLSALRLAWRMALLLFFVRLFAIFMGSFFGGLVAGAPRRIRRMTWLGMVTQAGIGLGLSKEVAVSFPEWGGAFATTIIAVIVANQMVGPPVEKWLLRHLGEARVDPTGGGRQAPRVLIFGVDGQSWALAQQLADHGWQPVLVSRRELAESEIPNSGFELLQIDGLSAESLRSVDAEKARTLVGLMEEKENAELCRIAHDELGVSNVVARVASQEMASICHGFGATAIDPNVALVNVLDHLVRSPSVTGMVVGMDPDRDVIEVRVTNRSLEGMALRDLRLPLDVLVLSIQREGASLISHGYTRLQMEDRVTVMGRRAELDMVRARLGRS